FIHQSFEERVHRNDVQLQFDNGRAESTFEVNMVVGQKNRVADLGVVDFEKVVVPQKADFDDNKTWLPGNCKAIEGHVYLERINDDRGNHGHVGCLEKKARRTA